MKGVSGFTSVKVYPCSELEKIIDVLFLGVGKKDGNDAKGWIPGLPVESPFHLFTAPTHRGVLTYTYSDATGLVKATRQFWLPGLTGYEYPFVQPDPEVCFIFKAYG
jgi:hypothetical protein